jgi:hypothetical protein
MADGEAKYTGPGFDVLSERLVGEQSDGALVRAATDVADKLRISSQIHSNGGVAGSLSRNRRNFPGTSSSALTAVTVDRYNDNVIDANELTARIKRRSLDDPAYEAAVTFLSTQVIREAERSMGQVVPTPLKALRISRGMRYLVHEALRAETSGDEAVVTVEEVVGQSDRYAKFIGQRFNR